MLQHDITVALFDEIDSLLRRDGCQWVSVLKRFLIRMRAGTVAADDNHGRGRQSLDFRPIDQPHCFAEKVDTNVFALLAGGSGQLTQGFNVSAGGHQYA